MPGTHGTPASAGQRFAKAGRSPVVGSSEIADSVRSSIPTAPNVSGSQARRLWSYSPVADAMPCDVWLSPAKQSDRYSASESQRTVRRNTAGSVSRSQRSFTAGYVECR